MKYALLAISAIILILPSCSEAVSELDKKKEALAEAETGIENLKKEIRSLREEISVLEGPGKQEVKKKLVTAIELSQQTFNHFIEIQGSAKSEDNIAISTDMGGLVTNIYIDEGQYVSRGQTLVQLDNSVVLTNIEELKTSLELAETVFTKQERLWNQKIGSEIQYLQAKSSKESLERKLQTAYTQLEKTKIKSPINGTVDEIFVKLGQMAAPGAPSIRVVNNKDIEIEADVSEAHLGAVKKRDKVTVSFPALELERTATVKSVGQVINPNNRTFKIILSILNKDEVLKPNLLATIKINDYSKENAIVIPTRLIHHTKGEQFVYAVSTDSNDQSIAEKIVIQPGKTYKGNTEITTGLSNEQVLVNDGYRDVTPGEILRINSQSKN